MNVEVMISMRKTRRLGRSAWKHTTHTVTYVNGVPQPKADKR